MIQKTFYVLSNGIHIPAIALGTWQMSDHEITYKSVIEALKAGYRHIDTATDYDNEQAVGLAIRDSNINRNDVFVTTKLQSHIKNYEGALAAFQNSLNLLGTDFIDLYLIHAPWPWDSVGKDFAYGNIQVFKAMEELYKAGKIRSIGVSNFGVADLKNIIEHCEIVPHVNQIVFSAHYKDWEIIDFCKANNILIQAYSPLYTGRILQNSTISEIAGRYAKTPAQLALQYCLQHNVLPIPKSITPSRIIENIQLDFIIQPEDMKLLDSL